MATVSAPSAPVDLRSDLLSRPTEEMIAEMAKAAREPAAFGLREDPRQARLERRAAELLGHEDALFFPTCTMANQTAIALLCAPGTAAYTQRDAHVLTSEAGAAAALSGVTLLPLHNGVPEAAEWAAAAGPGSESKPPPGAFVLENTYNRGGGLPLSPEYIDDILDEARSRGVSCHLDGARLPNAAVSFSQPMQRFAAGFDTVALSLNKGLGAPMGAILAGSSRLIARALTVRHRLGGGWRPTGIIAAAACKALEDYSHIVGDHARARMLAAAIADCPGITVREPPTNIVIMDLVDERLTPAGVERDLAEAGVLALAFGPRAVRMVTYRGIADGDIALAAERIRLVLSSAGRGASRHPMAQATARERPSGRRAG